MSKLFTKKKKYNVSPATISEKKELLSGEDSMSSSAGGSSSSVINNNSSSNSSPAPQAKTTTSAATTATTTTAPTTMMMVASAGDSQGLHNPLAWENTPKALQKIFPQWKDSSPGTAKRESPRSDEADRKFQFSSTFKRPDCTIPYVVMDRDTLNSIALKFDTTPSEIAQLNRKHHGASSVALIPGEVLYVPDAAEIAERRAKKKEEEFTKSAPPVVEAAKPSGSPNFRQTTSSGFLSVMGSALGKVAGKMRAASVDPPRPPVMPEEEVTREEGFASKYISEDHGCVNGSIVLTDSSFRFLPDPKDTLVLEHGAQMYKLNLPYADMTHVAISTELCIAALQADGRGSDVAMATTREDRREHPQALPGPRHQVESAGGKGEGERRLADGEKEKGEKEGLLLQSFTDLDKPGLLRASPSPPTSQVADTGGQKVTNEGQNFTDGGHKVTEEVTNEGQKLIGEVTIGGQEVASGGQKVMDGGKEATPVGVSGDGGGIDVMVGSEGSVKSEGGDDRGGGSKGAGGPTSNTCDGVRVESGEDVRRAGGSGEGVTSEGGSGASGGGGGGNDASGNIVVSEDEGVMSGGEDVGVMSGGDGVMSGGEDVPDEGGIVMHLGLNTGIVGVKFGRSGVNSGGVGVDGDKGTSVDSRGVDNNTLALPDKPVFNTGSQELEPASSQSSQEAEGTRDMLEIMGASIPKISVMGLNGDVCLSPVQTESELGEGEKESLNNFDSTSGGGLDQLTPPHSNNTDLLTFFLHIHMSPKSPSKFMYTPIGITIPVKRRGRESSPSVQQVRHSFCFAVPEDKADYIAESLQAHHPALSSGGNGGGDGTHKPYPWSKQDRKQRDRVPSGGSSSSTSVLRSWSGIYHIVCTEDENGRDLSFSDQHFLHSHRHSVDADSWEVYSLKDIARFRQRIECLEAVEDHLPLPTLREESDLLHEDHVHCLCKHLVSKAIGHDWHLVYSTFKHGISLQTLYRKMKDFHNTPAVILLVRDDTDKIFGAMLSCTLRISEHFYGSGESFLFSFSEPSKINVFSWTGENDYFVKGNKDSIGIGSGDGHFGLWLDEYLLHGSSYRCATFNNDCLSEETDFKCCGLEVWGFSEQENA